MTRGVLKGPAITGTILQVSNLHEGYEVANGNNEHWCSADDSKFLERCRFKGRGDDLGKVTLEQADEGAPPAARLPPGAAAARRQVEAQPERRAVDARKADKDHAFERQGRPRGADGQHHLFEGGGEPRVVDCGSVLDGARHKFGRPRQTGRLPLRVHRHHDYAQPPAKAAEDGVALTQVLERVLAAERDLARAVLELERRDRRGRVRGAASALAGARGGRDALAHDGWVIG